MIKHHCNYFLQNHFNAILDSLKGILRYQKLDFIFKLRIEEKMKFLIKKTINSAILDWWYKKSKHLNFRWITL